MDATGEIEIGALEEPGTFITPLRKGVPKYEVCISGGFVYTIRNKPLRDGHTKTDAYVDNRRRLAARF